ncbi:MAG: sigma-70 family RNA polymerase sigma factor [Proteobacteria bacterium]|jgi:RNA polymerase sigma factor (sigma-70 family)|nr:sigma-70 family RNA polymerase sigma factor [Pseudomonadota bacterium]
MTRIADRVDQELDQDLARLRSLRHDRGAFEALYRDFYPRLFEFVLRILGAPADAEETINDTMMVVWNKAHEFREQSKVSTWIFGIAYKKALKRLQSNKRLAARELQCEAEQEDRRDPADTVSHRAAIERIRVAVGKLPLAQRSIVQLAFFYGYSYPEIAAIVGCPVNTVKTRMFYARERLKPALELAMSLENADDSR